MTGRLSSSNLEANTSRARTSKTLNLGKCVFWVRDRIFEENTKLNYHKINNIQTLISLFPSLYLVSLCIKRLWSVQAASSSCQTSKTVFFVVLDQLFSSLPFWNLIVHQEILILQFLSTQHGTQPTYIFRIFCPFENRFRTAMGTFWQLHTAKLLVDPFQEPEELTEDTY